MSVTEAPKPHILIVDDDREIRDLLSRYLSKWDFRTTVAKDGREMEQALKDWSIDLIILDLMMPGEDGLTLCRKVRAQYRVPIIMLTAVGADVDRIVGLEGGADDYIPKPFTPRELIARMKSILRRVSSPSVPVPERRNAEKLLFAGFVVDQAMRTLAQGDHVVSLTAGEYDLLIVFIQHPHRILTRGQLLDLSRGRIPSPYDRSIDVQVGRLRRKIESNPKAPMLIKTTYRGYVFTSDVALV